MTPDEFEQRADEVIATLAGWTPSALETLEAALGLSVVWPLQVPVSYMVGADPGEPASALVRISMKAAIKRIDRRLLPRLSKFEEPPFLRAVADALAALAEHELAMASGQPEP